MCIPCGFTLQTRQVFLGQSRRSRHTLCVPQLSSVRGQRGHARVRHKGKGWHIAAYLSVVQRGHDEALCEVVEVLGQDELVVALLPAARVQEAALHPARSKQTNAHAQRSTDMRRKKKRCRWGTYDNGSFITGGEADDKHTHLHARKEEGRHGRLDSRTAAESNGSGCSCRCRYRDCCCWGMSPERGGSSR